MNAEKRMKDIFRQNFILAPDMMWTCWRMEKSP